MEELIAEILVRFPPDEPAGLFRASLVCKPWCRLISEPRFRRKYREFHRTHPMLGFFCGRITGDGFNIARFVPVVLPPPTSFFGQPVVLTTTQDGWLGLATMHESKLYVWSRKHGPEAADALWTCDGVIELETLLRSNATILTEPTVLLGFVEQLGVIFLRAGGVLFTVDLKTSKVKKVCDDATSIHTVVPYMSFCTPDLRGPRRGEGPSAGGSTA